MELLVGLELDAELALFDAALWHAPELEVEFLACSHVLLEQEELLPQVDRVRVRVRVVVVVVRVLVLAPVRMSVPMLPTVLLIAPCVLLTPVGLPLLPSLPVVLTVPDNVLWAVPLVIPLLELVSSSDVLLSPVARPAPVLLSSPVVPDLAMVSIVPDRSPLRALH